MFKQARSKSLNYSTSNFTDYQVQAQEKSVNGAGRTADYLDTQYHAGAKAIIDSYFMKNKEWLGIKKSKGHQFSRSKQDSSSVQRQISFQLSQNSDKILEFPKNQIQTQNFTIEEFGITTLKHKTQQDFRGISNGFQNNQSRTQEWFHKKKQRRKEKRSFSGLPLSTIEKLPSIKNKKEQLNSLQIAESIVVSGKKQQKIPTLNIVKILDETLDKTKDTPQLTLNNFNSQGILQNNVSQDSAKLENNTTYNYFCLKGCEIRIPDPYEKMSAKQSLSKIHDPENALKKNYFLKHRYSKATQMGLFYLLKPQLNTMKELDSNLLVQELIFSKLTAATKLKNKRVYQGLKYIPKIEQFVRNKSVGLVIQENCGNKISREIWKKEQRDFNIWDTKTKYEHTHVYRQTPLYAMMEKNTNLIREIIKRVAQAIILFSHYNIVHNGISLKNVLIRWQQIALFECKITDVKVCNYNYCFLGDNTKLPHKQLYNEYPEEIIYTAPELMKTLINTKKSYVKSSNNNNTSVETQTIDGKELVQRYLSSQSEAKSPYKHQENEEDDLEQDNKIIENYFSRYYYKEVPWGLDIWSLGMLILELYTSIEYSTRIQDLFYQKNQSSTVLQRKNIFSSQCFDSNSEFYKEQLQFLKNIPEFLKDETNFCFKIEDDIKEILEGIFKENPFDRINPMQLIKKLNFEDK